MNQIKKIIVGLIIGLISILAFYTTSIAYSYDIGDRLAFSYSEYATNGDIYCVEKGQHLDLYYNAYKVISKVNIEGNKSTDYTGKTRTSWHNAKLAYILSANNGVGEVGPVANGVWNYMYTWIENVGKYHEGIYRGFSNGVQGSVTWLDGESTNYANNYLNDTTKISDNTKKENIKVVSYEKDGKSYARVGPFNWSFPGTMKKVTAKDQDGKTIDGILYSSFKGKEQYWYKASEIKSGSNFYISIPINAGVSKITEITGEAKKNVKAVNIWFLKSELSGNQNLIIREPYETPVDIKTPFEYDITMHGDLKVIKVDEDNNEIKLEGVGFNIQYKDTGKYVHKNNKGKISYVNKENATEFTTDSKGEILIKNLLVGDYIAYETKNSNYGYEIIKDGINKKVVVDKTNELKVGNKQTEVKLSGYVWVDKVAIGKNNKRNDSFKDSNSDDGDDILFNGITVRLKDRTKNGEIVKVKDKITGELKNQEVVTSKLDRYKSPNDGNGEYLFEGVEIEKLGNYYIEFEYDGLTYTNVIPKIKKDNGSKSAEGQARDEFNKKFSVVEGGGSTMGYTLDGINGNREYELSYKVENHKATLENNGKQYKITANTDLASYNIKDHFVAGEEEIRYINLGLYKREQPDISVLKDIENVNVAVNGYTHVYDYNQRLNNAQYYSEDYLNNYIDNGGKLYNKNENGDYIEAQDGIYFRDEEGNYVEKAKLIFNVGVKFGDKYGNMSYRRAIYKSDYLYYNNENKSNELKVNIIYKLTIVNQSINLKAQVNKMVDYFDKNYEFVKMGSELDEKGNIKDNGMIQPETQGYNDEYKKIIIENNINANMNIEKGSEKTIYVQFALNREAVGRIINNEENLDNVVEISSYSIFDSENKTYAGIDKNSNPGNCEPGNKDTYENDTDSSPALKLEFDGEREISGTVFVDKDTVSSDLKTGQIRQGDGIYDEGKETPIEGVEVKLMKDKVDQFGNVIGRVVAKEYVYNEEKNEIEEGDELKATTDSGGNFTIKGYVPGDYVLTYTWGDKTYTVQDYKSTIYDPGRDEKDKNWYKNDVEIRKNDAIDNYETRKKIDSEIQSGNVETKKMDSSTPIMGIGIEQGDDGSTKIGRTPITSEIIDQDQFKPLGFNIKNVDFGIIERARQVLDISKDVTGVKITLANGQTIIDGKIVDGKLKGDLIKGLTYMGPLAGNNGSLKAEIDNELIQGATVQIEYTVKVANRGEKDYDSYDYYAYGNKAEKDKWGNVIKMKPEKVYDYLDSQMGLDGTQDNSKWKVVSRENVDTKETIIENHYKNSKKTENGSTKWETSRELYKTIFEEWSTMVTEERTVKDAKLNNKTILENADLEAALEPGKNKEINLYTSKILANEDEIDLNNDVELAEIKRVGETGRMPKVETSQVYDRGETVVVTPPTGENQSYLLPIIIGLSALIILGAGVIVIKKRVI